MTALLPNASLRAFVISHLAKNLLWTGEDAFAFYVLVVVLKLDPALAGGVFLAGAAWNAVLDFAWGALIAQRPELARRLPLVAAAAVPVACLSFALLPFVGSAGPCCAIALILTFRTSFALFDVPHNALNSTLAAHSGHLALMRLRSIAAGAGALIVAAMALPLLLIADPRLPGLIFATLSAVAFAGLLPLPWMLARIWQDRRMERPIAPGLSTVAGAALWVLPFCAAQMVGAGALGAIGKGLLHLKVRTQWVLAAAPIAIGLARLAAIPAWNALARKHGSARGLGIAYLCIGSVILLLPVAVDAGTLGALLAFLVFGALVGGIALLAWSGFSELIAHNSTTRDPGASSLAYGLFSATSKIGLGASACLTGTWLEAQSERILSGTTLWPLAGAAAALCTLCGVLACHPRNKARVDLEPA